jgi:hypothetical protein
LVKGRAVGNAKGLQMPTVRLVTPTDNTTSNESIKAFEDELQNNKNLGWGNITKVYSPADWSGSLDSAAQHAVSDPPAPDVIVTAGVIATNIVLGKTATIPIVQAVGGSNPTIPAGQTNVTGFIINALKTAQDQMALLNGQVLVLYDDTPDTPTVKNPSNAIYSALDASKKNPLGAQTPAALNSLDPAKLVGMSGFMILPNAMFYRYSGRVVKYVDGKKKPDGTTPLPIYYPEREYKNAHLNKANVSVLGHSVLITYRLAAHYVNNILTGYWSIAKGNLPTLQEAVQDSS